MSTSPVFNSRRVAVVRPLRRFPSSSTSEESPIQLPQAMEEDIEEEWPIRTTYLCITLADVACETEANQLQQWLELFSPSAQPQSSEEHFYVNTMNSAIQNKLSLLE